MGLGNGTLYFFGFLGVIISQISRLSPSYYVYVRTWFYRRVLTPRCRPRRKRMQVVQLKANENFHTIMGVP